MKRSVTRGFTVIFLALGFCLAFTSVVQAQENQGCGLGFWKQTQHYDSWVDVAPTDSFYTVFGVAPENRLEIRLKKKDGGGKSTDPTMHQALNSPGGGINALARQAVAALLNAENEDVNYGISPGDVIMMFQVAFEDGSRAAIEELKDTFEALNELTCPFASTEMEEEIE